MDGIHRFLYKREKPFMTKVMSLLIITVTILWFRNVLIVAIPLVIVAIALFIYEEGIEVDFKVHTYRLITAIGPLAVGKWQAFPSLKSISVFKANIVSSVTSRGGTTLTERDSVIQVNLITQQNKRIKLLETKDAAEAFAFAQKVAPEFNLAVWDATEREGKWL